MVVVGAGQAGLSSAYFLRRRGLVAGQDFVLLDANDGPGGAWRHRWSSLTLGRTHHVHDLPGSALRVPDPDEPSSVIARYYGGYERQFELAVRRPVRVRRVTSPEGPSGPLVVHTDAGDWSTDALISATGAWDSPFWPAYPGRERFTGRQLHIHDFVSMAPFQGQHVLVVGGGTSAVQFLLEAHGVATTTWFTRRPPVFLDRDFDAEWGQDVERRVAERGGQGLTAASVVATTGLPLTAAYRQGIESGVLVALPMFTEIIESGVRLADGGDLSADAIVWATGFRASLRHLAPLELREPGGGIAVNGTQAVRDSRIQLVGYGPSASTLGATRAGRQAVRAALGVNRAGA